MTDARSGYPNIKSAEIRIIIDDPEAIKLAMQIQHLYILIKELRNISEIKRLVDSKEISDAIDILNERLERLKEKLLGILYEKSEEVDIKINIR